MLNVYVNCEKLFDGVSSFRAIKALMREHKLSHVFVVNDDTGEQWNCVLCDYRLRCMKV
jgi:hypothetical protein